MVQEGIKIKKHLDAVLADEDSISVWHGNSRKFVSEKSRSVSAVRLDTQEPANLRPYRVIDYVRELMGSQSPNREY